MAGNGHRLIIVSNRLPVRLREGASDEWNVVPSSGGLVTALAPVLRRHGGTWIGWPGRAVDDVGKLERRLNPASAPYRLVPIGLSEQEVERFYGGFANQVVWPLFHDCFHLCNFDPEFWRAYESANLKFARKAAELAKPGDIIWVHDYQLMGVGAALRRLGVDNEIGFFNHIPFPTADIFCRLPWRQAILDSLLEYDLIGFQLGRDEAHFHDCLASLSRSARSSFESPQRRYRQRDPRVGRFPISIDFEEFDAEASSDAAQELAAQLRRANAGRKILLGIDRLDYSKGLLEKLAAFRRALEKYPRLRGRATLIQHVVPSREHLPEYRALRLRIERAVSAINGAFSEPGWIPVHYYYQSLSRADLCAYYRAADLCLVTSQKDGMNLVAKEYCAAQVDDPGVLILSEFTGAAAEIGDDALRVNPFDTEAVSDAIYAGAAMSLVERAERMRRLRAHIRSHDVYRWVESYLAELAPPESRAVSLDKVAV
jgi:alpha,alpha-trehalose-phosphate synthase [UDP-forming]